MIPQKKHLHLVQFEDVTAILKYRHSSFNGKTPFRKKWQILKINYQFKNNNKNSQNVLRGGEVIGVGSRQFTEC